MDFVRGKRAESKIIDDLFNNWYIEHEEEINEILQPFIKTSDEVKKLKNQFIYISSKGKNEMIPRAEEARKQTINNIGNRTTKVLEEISEKISNAIQNGEFYITVNELSYIEYEQLRNLGYVVNSEFENNELFHKISWRRSI